MRRHSSDYYYNATSLWYLIKWVISLLCVRWGCYDVRGRRRTRQEGSRPDESRDREQGFATLITGASSGLGFECAKQIWQHTPSHKLVLCCRSGAKEVLSLHLCSTFGVSDQDFEIVDFDLGSLTETDQGARQIVNAIRIDAMLAVNVVSQYLLCKRLCTDLESLRKVVIIGSWTHRTISPQRAKSILLNGTSLYDIPTFRMWKENFHPLEVYTASKYCCVALSRVVQRMVDGMVVAVADPGAVNTGIVSNWPSLLRYMFQIAYRMRIVKPVEDGAGCVLKALEEMESHRLPSMPALASVAFFGKWGTQVSLSSSIDDRIATEFEDAIETVIAKIF